tara:strand:- start:2569 stop:3357 length:789 start_codon:yes stop_codon:yes gene_type:complete
MLAPSGRFMAFVAERRAHWYIQNGLASVVSKSGKKNCKFAFQLNFEPVKEGHSADSNADFFFIPRESICVVCGHAESLTRHHVVPFCYRKYLVSSYNDHSDQQRVFSGRGSYDIVFLCEGCHIKYEKHADRLRHLIADEYRIPLQGRGRYYDPKQCRAISAAKTLLKHGETIPELEKEQLMNRTRAWLQQRVVTKKDLVNLADAKLERLGNHRTHAQLLFEKIKDDFSGFVMRWRRHFIEKMEPKFMPLGWDADRNDIYKLD